MCVHFVLNCFFCRCQIKRKKVKGRVHLLAINSSENCELQLNCLPAFPLTHPSLSQWPTPIDVCFLCFRHWLFLDPSAGRGSITENDTIPYGWVGEMSKEEQNHGGKKNVGTFRMGADLNIYGNSCVDKGAEMAMSTDAWVKINSGSGC